MTPNVSFYMAELSEFATWSRQMREVTVKQRHVNRWPSKVHILENAHSWHYVSSCSGAITSLMQSDLETICQLLCDCMIYHKGRYLEPARKVSHRSVCVIYVELMLYNIYDTFWRCLKV